MQATAEETVLFYANKLEYCTEKAEVEEAVDLIHASMTACADHVKGDLVGNTPFLETLVAINEQYISSKNPQDSEDHAEWRTFSLINEIISSLHHIVLHQFFSTLFYARQQQFCALEYVIPKLFLFSKTFFMCVEIQIAFFKTLIFLCDNFSTASKIICGYNPEGEYFMDIILFHENVHLVVDQAFTIIYFMLRSKLGTIVHQNMESFTADRLMRYSGVEIITERCLNILEAIATPNSLTKVLHAIEAFPDSRSIQQEGWMIIKRLLNGEGLIAVNRGVCKLVVASTHSQYDRLSIIGRLIDLDTTNRDVLRNEGACDLFDGILSSILAQRPKERHVLPIFCNTVNNWCFENPVNQQMCSSHGFIPRLCVLLEQHRTDASIANSIMKTVATLSFARDIKAEDRVYLMVQVLAHMKVFSTDVEIVSKATAALKNLIERYFLREAHALSFCASDLVEILTNILRLYTENTAAHVWMRTCNILSLLEGNDFRSLFVRSKTASALSAKKTDNLQDTTKVLQTVRQMMGHCVEIKHELLCADVDFHILDTMWRIVNDKNSKKAVTDLSNIEMFFVEGSQCLVALATPRILFSVLALIKKIANEFPSVTARDKRLMEAFDFFNSAQILGYMP